MDRRSFARAAGLVLAMSLSLGGIAAETPAPAEESWTLPLEVGLRFSDNWLETSRSAEGFLGSIDELDPDQRYLPCNIVVAWRPLPWLSLGVQWDQMRARTVTATADHHSDGSFRVRGPLLGAALRWPDDDPVQPYAELGLAVLSVDFDESTWWGNGYPSVADWEAAGKPSTPYRGKQRTLSPSDSTSWTAGCGVLVPFGAHWALDLNLRYVDAESEVGYAIRYNGVTVDEREKVKIPLAYYAASLGVRYLF